MLIVNDRVLFYVIFLALAVGLKCVSVSLKFIQHFVVVIISFVSVSVLQNHN